VTFRQCVRVSAVSGGARAGLRQRSALGVRARPQKKPSCSKGTYPLLPTVTAPAHRVFFFTHDARFVSSLAPSLSLSPRISRCLRALRRAGFYRGF